MKLDEKKLKENNTIALVLRSIAQIILGLGIATYIIDREIQPIMFVVGIGWVLVLYALKEIIQILHDIRLKVYKK